MNFFQAKAIAYMDEYDRLVNSKMVKWFYTAPSTDWIRDLIKYYNAIGMAQTILLIVVTIYTLRWVYADSVVRGRNWIGLSGHLVLILGINFLVYFVFSSWRLYHLLLKMG